MSKLEAILFPLIVISLVGFAIAWFGSITPFGEDHTITGYLSDFDHQTGWGYSGTTLVINNMSYNLSPRYQKSIPINQNVRVTYKNCILGEQNKIIFNIEVI